jgi:hypothetical protein
MRAVRAAEKAGFHRDRMVDTPDGPALLMVRNAHGETLSLGATTSTPRSRPIIRSRRRVERFHRGAPPGAVRTKQSEDESFRFMTGFSISFAIGILLLGSEIGFTMGGVDIWLRVVAAALMWALSELLVLRRAARHPVVGVLYCLRLSVVPADLVRSSVPRFPLAARSPTRCSASPARRW